MTGRLPRERRDTLLKLQPQPAPAAASTHPERAEALKQRQQGRRDALAARKTALVDQHTREGAALRELQQAQTADIFKQRERKQPRGVAAFLTRITGINILIQIRHRTQDKQRAAEHRRQTGALRRRHDREMADIKRRERALGYIEKREARSLRTTLYRDQNRNLKRSESEKSRSGGRIAPPALKIDFMKVTSLQPSTGKGAGLPNIFNEAVRSAGTAQPEGPPRTQDIEDTADHKDLPYDRERDDERATFLSQQFNPQADPVAEATTEPERPPIILNRADPRYPVPKPEPRPPLSARERLDQQRRALQDKQAGEREELAAIHRRWEASVARERAKEHAKGLLPTWLSRVTGAQANVDEREQSEDQERHKKQQRQSGGQRYRHERELQEFDRQYRTLSKLEQEGKAPDAPEPSRDDLGEFLRHRAAQKRRSREQDQAAQRKPPGKDRGRS
jgi:hypothetical protein